MTDSPAADMKRAEDLARQALATSPRSPLSHMAIGGVLRAQGRYTEALREYEAVITLNRNWVAAYHHIGQCKLFTGSIEEVIPLVEQAIRLSPHDYNIGDFYNRIGLVHLLQSRTDEAIIWFEKACSVNPAPALLHAQLASAYALKGAGERAATELAEARRLTRSDRYSSISRLRASQYFGVPKIRALFEATFLAGLRLAGMPEE
jgi:tetratricopeptide (TPR) repeat protein